MWCSTRSSSSSWTNQRPRRTKGNVVVTTPPVMWHSFVNITVPAAQFESISETCFVLCFCVHSPHTHNKKLYAFDSIFWSQAPLWLMRVGSVFHSVSSIMCVCVVVHYVLVGGHRGVIHNGAGERCTLHALPIWMEEPGDMTYRHPTTNTPATKRRSRKSGCIFYINGRKMYIPLYRYIVYINMYVYDHVIPNERIPIVVDV